MSNLTISDVDVPGQDLDQGEVVNDSYDPGDRFTVDINVTNTGTSTANSSRAGLYIVLNGSAQLVDTEFVSSLGPGDRSPNETLSFNLPDDLAPGLYGLIVQADYNNQISETDETDNAQGFIIEVVRALPNLTIADVDVGSQDISEGEIVRTPYSAGDSFSATVDVENDGAGDASSSVLGLYLVRNGTAQLVDTNPTGSLSAGSTNTNETLAFSLPSDLEPGRYELLIKTDYDDSVDESDIGDNIQSFFIDVVANQPPEITIEAASSYAAGTVLDGSDLISVTDPDGSSDIQNVLVYDAINSPGAVWRFNGTVIDPGGAGNQFELDYDNLNLLTYTVGTGSDTFSFEARDFSGNISNEASHTITAVVNDPPLVTIEAASSYAAGTVLNGADLISVTDPDGSSDIQNVLVYDAINSPGAVWRFNGTVIDPGGAGNQFEFDYDNLNLLTYTVGTGSDTFSFEARDFSGNISNEAVHTITAVVNDPPVVAIEAASSYAAGTVLDGNDLITVTDPDGSSDIQNVLVYDAINSPGAVWRFNGTVIDPGGAGNQFELDYDNLNLLTYTVGTGSDTFSFEARDFSGNISNEASHTITATTVETAYSLSPSVETIEEGDRTITFAVTRTGSNLIAESLYYSTLFGSASAATGDYDGAVDQELPFVAGQAQASFTISINEDLKDENDETFRVMIAAEENVSSSRAEAIASVTILDDDTVSTSTDYPTVQPVDTSVANPLDTISYGVNSYLTSSLDPFFITLEEQGEVTTRITRADDPDYEESDYWGLVLPDQPFEITFPGNHAPAGYEVSLEVERAGQNDSLIDLVDIFERIESLNDETDWIITIGEFGNALSSVSGAAGYAPDIVEGFAKGVLAKIGPLSVLSIALDVPGIVSRVEQAETEDQAAILFSETMNLVHKTAFIAGTSTLWAVTGTAVGGTAAVITGFLPFAGVGFVVGGVAGGVAGNYAYVKELEAGVKQFYFDLFKVWEPEAIAFGDFLIENAEGFSSFGYDLSSIKFDEEFYAQAYPGAVDAVERGEYGSLYGFYLSEGIDLGHVPNSGSSGISRFDLAVSLDGIEPLLSARPAFDAESLLGDELSLPEFTVANSTAPTIELAPQSSLPQTNSFASLSQASSGPASAQVSAELSAAANRIAQDWILNNSNEAFARQDRSNPDGWAEIVSSGDDFRTALSGISWSELQLDNSVQMIALLTSETDPAAVYNQFISSAEGAAFLSDPSIQSIGVGEYGGLWVIVVDDVAYANDAVVSTEVLNNRQFGTDNADVVFAGASASQVSLFDGSDSFVGGAHKDIVRPGLGKDILTLGAGLDVVVGTLAELDGTTITDFEPGDIIVLEGDYANPISRTYNNATGLFTLDPFGDGSATAQIQLPARLGVSTLLEGSNFAGEGYGFEAKGASGRPDASFSGYSSGTPNTELFRGEDFSTYFEVTNTVFGDTSFGQQVSAKVVFSRDYIVSKDDIFLGDFVVGDLATGERSTFSNATVTLPSDMGTGEYYVGVVVDPENDVAETYEINNVAWYTHTFLVSASANTPPSVFVIDAGVVSEDGGAVSFDLLGDAGAADSDGGTLGVAAVAVTDQLGAAVGFGLAGSVLTIDPSQFAEALSFGESATLTVSYIVTDGQGGETPNTGTLVVEGLDGPFTWYLDGDADGFGVDDAATNQLAYVAPAGTSEFAGDADDTDATVYPGAPEINDGKDNDQDGLVDEDNADPVADAEAFEVAANGTLGVPVAALLDGDTDADGDALTVVSVSAAVNGTVALEDKGDADPANDEVLFTPTPGYSGLASFEYTVSDGQGGADTATVNITVTDQPTGPTPVFDVASAVAFNGTPGGVIELPHAALYEFPAGTVSFAFTAADTNGAQGLFVKDASGYVGGGNHFAMYLDGSTLVARFQDGGSQDIVQVPGIVAGQTYDVAMTFDANGGAIWLDGVQVASTDLVMDWTQNNQVIQWGGRGWGSGNGQTGFDAPFEGTMSDRQVYDVALSAAQIAALHSDGPPNANPIANDDTLAIDEDTPGVIDPTLNDSDPDGDGLSVGAIVTGPANGNAAIAGNSVTYTPDADFFGSDSFVVEIRDGNGGTATSTVTVTVAPVEDDPQAADDTATVLPDTATVIDVLGNDSDGDNDPLSVTLESPASNGSVVRNPDNTFTYTPDPGFSGSDSFVYRLSDGDGPTDTATVSITVTDQSTGPIPVFDVAGAVAFNGTPGGVIELPHAALYEFPAGTVSFAFTAADTNGAQGLFVKDASGYVGGGNHFAMYLDGSTLVARFQDGGSQDIVQVPGIVAGQTYDVAMTFDANGGAIWLDGVQVASTDLVMDWTQNTQVIQWGGRGWGSGNGQTGFDAPFEGTMSDRQVYDVALDAAQIAALHSDGPPNANPIANDDTLAIDEDTPGVIDPTSNDSDPDGDGLSVGAILTGPANGSAAIAGNSVTYTPDTDFFGSDSFVVEIRDGNGGTATSTVNVTVASVEDDPQAADDTATVLPDTATVIDVLSNDSDGDNDPLSVTLESPTANGSVVRNPDNTFTYTPDPGFSGSDSFVYRLSDGDGPSDTATVEVTVADQPSGPTPVFDQSGVRAYSGANDDVDNYAPDPDLNINAGTIAFSFVADDTVERQGLVTKDASGFAGGGNHFASYVERGDLKLRFQDEADSVEFVFNDIEVGREYEVAATFDENGVALFVDGALFDRTDDFVMDWTQNDQYLQSGGLGWASANGAPDFENPFSGQIADLEIYDAVLDPGAIASLATQTSIEIA